MHPATYTSTVSRFHALHHVVTWALLRLKPTTHIKQIVAKAHQFSNAILRSFVSRDIDLLVCAFSIYVITLLEYNSVVWSPQSEQDIELIEHVQRQFTKRLSGLKSHTYACRLEHLKVPSLMLRRLLYTDLVWCYCIFIILILSILILTTFLHDIVMLLLLLVAMVTGLFVPLHFRSRERKNHREYFRSRGTFVPWNIRSRGAKSPRTFVPWNFRSCRTFAHQERMFQELSFHGTFAPLEPSLNKQLSCPLTFAPVAYLRSSKTGARAYSYYTRSNVSQSVSQSVELLTGHGS